MTDARHDEDRDHRDRTGGGRTIDLSVEVPGTPEEVWEAVATGPGISSWFVPHEVDERAGGGVRMDFGEGFGEETGTVTAWDPPRRVVFEGTGERALAYEWLVEARDGGTCVVRLVNTGFGPGEDWDADYHGMSEGWRIFLANLRLHLTHHRGQRARAVIPTVMLPGPLDDAFSRLCAALGVRDDLGAGDRLEVAAPGAPALAGTVQERVATGASATYFLVLDAPAPGTAFVGVEGMGDQVGASLYLYLYGPDADAAAQEAAGWRAFLEQRVAAPA
ncbi:SRPBCC family protein [Vallicoccus soli]|uniref:SRPBCC domain-containing protein n=1 Tax=Vallicoccus soli TaxID=2339232 RepID=A0A3A3YX94_9ACTN|nr:SRPBCC domain-containing protein [Vallicoccus soli]RJK94888.1 SRPBCC domain-containing protein [Vallicoccus soli]